MPDPAPSATIEFPSMYILRNAILGKFARERDPMRSTTRHLLTAMTIGVITAAIIGGHQGLVVSVTYALCLALIWFTGIRALIIWMRSRSPTDPAAGTAIPRIALLYCTADDLSATALRASAAQDVPVDVYLLDDSTSAAVRTAVDALAAELCATVIRRENRTGAKAGNINHGLGHIDPATDAVVILDSDTVLPADFVRRTSAALIADARIACVQAVPVAGGKTHFARFFGPLVQSHARINHATRARIGFPAFVGRGALLSVHALRAVGGFPLAVSEDLALSVRLREHGYRIVHRPEIEFHEDFPIDYAAFRVQQGKAAEGATEFLFSARNRALPRRESADLLMETALLPLGAAAGLAALALGTTLALRGTPMPPLLAAVTAVLALAPLLPEAVRRLRAHAPLSAALFLALAPLLYASVALHVIRHTAAVARGRSARFVVTPKQAARTGISRALATMHLEWSWALMALTVAIALQTPLLGVPFLMPAVTGTILLLWGARTRSIGPNPVPAHARVRTS